MQKHRAEACGGAADTRGGLTKVGLDTPIHEGTKKPRKKTHKLWKTRSPVKERRAYTQETTERQRLILNGVKRDCQISLNS